MKTLLNRISGLLVPLFVLLTLPAVVQAQFIFITNNGAITITGYTGSGGEVVIPDKTNGLPVTSIGEKAFYRCSSLTSLTIPNSITSIGAEAFESCFGLTSLAIPNSVTNIGDSAFAASGLTTFTFPNSVTSIGEEAFCDCSGLSSVTIPNSVTNIGEEAFGSCYSLTNVTIPNSVINISDFAFDGSGLTSVTIPSGVRSIGGYAFRFSTLTNVTIPSSVTNIGDFAFEGCTRLIEIMVDGENSFYSSVNGVLFDRNRITLIEYSGGAPATSYTIPNSVTGIGDGAFQGSGLASVMIPNSVTSIGEKAFETCLSLTNVTIPNSVTSIGDSAFYECYYLTNVTIGNRVSSIGDKAFEICHRLTSVTIPNSVISIGDYAFSYCPSLTKAYFLGNAPSGDSTVFSGEFGTVYYLPGTTGWGSTFGGWPTALWYQPKPLILGNGGGLGVQSNQFGFTISWATNLSVVVQASTNLVKPIWTPVATNALTNGTSTFRDPQWTNYPARFYRLRSP